MALLKKGSSLRALEQPIMQKFKGNPEFSSIKKENLCYLFQGKEGCARNVKLKSRNDWGYCQDTRVILAVMKLQ